MFIGGEKNFFIACRTSFLSSVWLHLFISQVSTALGGKCGHPAVPTNGRVTLSDESLLPGTIASYQCEQGYQLFGSEMLSCSPNGLWIGEMPFCGMNVATRRPSNQSTTARGGNPGNANDGDVSSARCSETTREVSPWWQVDLLKPYPVKAVKITTRGCCGHQPLHDLEIRVGNSSWELQRNPLCAWFPETIEEGITKTFICARSIVGQHVFIQLVGIEGSLSLCEVQVFTTDEISPEACATRGTADSVELATFGGQCFQFNLANGASFELGRAQCKKEKGDLIHALSTLQMSFVLSELERRRDKLKTLLVWIGVQKEPGQSRIWKWVNGEVVSKPSWGKDQPNNYNGEQNCAVLDGAKNWLWNDVGCHLDYLNWICQRSPMFCGSPDKYVNTTILSTNDEDRKVGSKIEYACPDGHRLIGDKYRMCNKQGAWSGSPPTCQYVDCGELAAIEHGTVELVENRTTYGAEAKYSCYSNYSLSGLQSRICAENGRWSGESPECLFDWCPDPPEISGALVTITGKRTGSIAAYTCQAGYVLIGQSELTCGVGGEWSKKVPTCRYVDCGTPPSIDNGGYRLINDSTTHGSLLEYSCHEDYWLEPQSSQRQICNKDGKWSDIAPQCEIITCPEPNVPIGSYIVGFDFNIHSKIEFHCEPGHMLIGEPILECMSNGDWSANSPSCRYVDCGKLPVLLYGSISYSNSSTNLDSQVTYSCSNNYKIVGNPTRRCLQNQTWSGVAPKCEEIRCSEPTLPEHSIVSVTGNDRLHGRTLIRTSGMDTSTSSSTYKIGALVKYRCERGYKMMGEPLSTCDDTGSWSGTVPTCIFVDCGLPDSIEHGSFMLASNVTYYGSAALYECDDRYQLEGHARRLCMENATWSSTKPRCKEIVCNEPEAYEGQSVRFSSRVIGSVAEYSCPRGHKIDGDASRECLSKGVWSGGAPFCKLIECGEPESVENGRVILVNGTVTYGSTAEYHCIPQFHRVGAYLRRCAQDGAWFPELPKCIHVSAASSTGDHNVSWVIGVTSLVIICLLIILGLIYFKLKQAKPVKNSENIQAAMRKEEEGAAAMSYATLNDGRNNIYEKIPGSGETSLYDCPYEESGSGLSHYEPSPVPSRYGARTAGNVTINGVAVR